MIKGCGKAVVLYSSKRDDTQLWSTCSKHYSLKKWKKRKKAFCQKFCLAFGNTFLGFGPSQSMKENCGDFQLTKIGYCSLLCWFGTNFLLHVCSVLSGWQFSVTNGNNGGMYASAFMKLAEKKGTAGFCPLIISRLGQKPPPHLVSISYWENAFHPVTF